MKRTVPLSLRVSSSFSTREGEDEDEESDASEKDEAVNFLLRFEPHEPTDLPRRRREDHCPLRERRSLLFQSV